MRLPAFVLTFIFAAVLSATSNQPQQLLMSRIAADCLPKLYASMGTPLYETLFVFDAYKHLEGMDDVLRTYSENMLPVYSRGMQLNQAKELSKTDRSSYLMELRELESEKKRVMHHLTTLTMKAVDTDDFETFKSLVALPLDELLPTLSTRTKAINYYESKPQSRITALSELAAQERQRKMQRQKQTRRQYADAINAPRSYRLVQHLPSAGIDSGARCEQIESAAPDAAESKEGTPSPLKAVGIVFKSLGVNFDPGLLEDYKTHKPPSVDDIE